MDSQRNCIRCGQLFTPQYQGKSYCPRCDFLDKPRPRSGGPRIATDCGMEVGASDHTIRAPRKLMKASAGMSTAVCTWKPILLFTLFVVVIATYLFLVYA